MNVQKSSYTVILIFANIITVDCGNPISINNTEVRLLNETTTYGSRAEYSCESEGICSAKMTSVTGNHTVVECQADGQWSTSDIECVKKSGYKLEIFA